MVDIIYAPVLGQSNGQSMKNFYGDADSGHTTLEAGLESITGLTAI